MGAVSASRYTVMAGWDDVPHLTEEAKADLLSSTEPYLRDARSKGIPSLGAGAIYPRPWEEIEVAPFAIPDYWRRGYGMDVGWNRTAAIWLAEDPLDLTLYAYAEYYRGQAIPAIHAEAIKLRGEWIQGEIDPASRGRGQRDGEQLLANYQSLGLKVRPAINAVDSGIYQVWSLIETGRLKFFSTLRHTAAEYRLYRRKVDNEGRTKIVKENDHLMDAKRYIVTGFDRSARVKPADVAMVEGVRVADRRAGY